MSPRNLQLSEAEAPDRYQPLGLSSPQTISASPRWLAGPPAASLASRRAHPPSSPAYRLAALFRRRTPLSVHLAAVRVRPPVVCLAARPALEGSPPALRPSACPARDPPCGFSFARPAPSRRSHRPLGARRTLRVTPSGVNFTFPQVTACGDLYPQVTASRQRVTKSAVAGDSSQAGPAMRSRRDLRQQLAIHAQHLSRGRVPGEPQGLPSSLRAEGSLEGRVAQDPQHGLRMIGRIVTVDQ
jgi:hypothetical protein